VLDPVAAAGTAAGDGTASGDAANPDGVATIAVVRTGPRHADQIPRSRGFAGGARFYAGDAGKAAPIVIVLPERTPINVNTALGRSAGGGDPEFFAVGGEVLAGAAPQVCPG
jgi:hypothetical protein